MRPFQSDDPRSYVRQNDQAGDFVSELDDMRRRRAGFAGDRQQAEEGVMQNPFESIESALQYIGLLLEQVKEVETSIHDDIAAASGDGSRRIEALRVVSYKLGQLRSHLTSSGRTLNDLRALRRLLLRERENRSTR